MASVSLDKGTIISLTVGKDAPVTRARMGLGWRPAVEGASIDLDASCILFQGSEYVDIVWFQHLQSYDGSVVHSGDDRTGRSATPGGDNETITVDFQAIPAHIDSLVFTVNSYTGQPFSQVASASCHLVDISEPQQQPPPRHHLWGDHHFWGHRRRDRRQSRDFGTFQLTDLGAHTGIVMAIAYRVSDGTWRIKMVGTLGEGSIWQQLLPTTQRELQSLQRS